MKPSTGILILRPRYPKKTRAKAVQEAATFLNPANMAPLKILEKEYQTHVNAELKTLCGNHINGRYPLEAIEQEASSLPSGFKKIRP